jgi:hypothetical protein
MFLRRNKCLPNLYRQFNQNPMERMLASQSSLLRMQKASFRTSVQLNVEQQLKFTENEKDLENFDMLLNKISPEEEQTQILPTLVKQKGEVLLLSQPFESWPSQSIVPVHTQNGPNYMYLLRLDADKATGLLLKKE